MAGQLEKLRDELIGFEKIIAAFQKWKLIGIGVVFAAGLGISSGDNEGECALIALLAIPMVTIYADLLIRDYDLRLCLIACFMREDSGVFGHYERFVHGPLMPKSLWLFGHVATAFSSVVANGAVIVLVLIKKTGQACPHAMRCVLLGGAAFGIVLAVITLLAYSYLVSRVFAKTAANI